MGRLCPFHTVEWSRRSAAFVGHVISECHTCTRWLSETPWRQFEFTNDSDLLCFFRWVFVWEKGYQETDSVVSSVTTKAKGVAVTNTSELGFRIWDVADYVIPAQVCLAVTRASS